MENAAIASASVPAVFCERFIVEFGWSHCETNNHVFQTDECSMTAWQRRESLSVVHLLDKP
ncbi:MAG: hypothetical protein JWP08_3700 [Bryobacterales bacterium]|nr:hypothetical protein [Bryobacterales bacterium]